MRGWAHGHQAGSFPGMLLVSIVTQKKYVSAMVHRICKGLKELAVAVAVACVVEASERRSDSNISRADFQLRLIGDRACTPQSGLIPV